MMQKPNIFHYENYRRFLADWYSWMKSSKKTFSFRSFSRWAGFKSPNQLYLVIREKRNISWSSLDTYCKILKLNKREKKYFELLVKLNQSKDLSLKTQYLKELSSHHLKQGFLLKKDQYSYLSNWYYPVIREMACLADFRDNPVWISKKLGGKITSQEAKQAIQTLLSLKLLKRDSKNKLLQTNHYVTTGHEIQMVASHIYHTQMSQLAMESLSTRKASERNFTALTFTIRQSDYATLVAEIDDFRKRFIDHLQNRPQKTRDESLYQININLFPIIKD